MTDGLQWDVEGRDWPNREASRFVAAGGIEWHVQRMGQGPVLLLLHGTGSSTHSWAKLLPILSAHFTLIAPDLPGHAFTQTPPREGLTLTGMSHLVGELLKVLGVTPDVVVGHSAGAAVLMRMCLDHVIAPKSLVSINGALLPFTGFAGSVFSPLAKALVLNPFVPRIFAWRARSRNAVQRVLEGTGSSVSERDLEIYARLFQTQAHVAGTLAMMAGWELEPLERDMPKLAVPLLLVASSNDKAVPPGDAERVCRLVPGASLRRIEGLGHLAHEERPDLVANIILERARELLVVR